MRANLISNKKQYDINMEKLQLSRLIMKKNKKFELFTEIVLGILDQSDLEKLASYTQLPRNSTPKIIKNKLNNEFNRIEQIKN